MILYYFFGFIVAAVVLVYGLHRRPSKEDFLDIGSAAATQVALQNTILNNQRQADRQQADKYVADYKQVVAAGAAAAAAGDNAAGDDNSLTDTQVSSSVSPPPPPPPTTYKDPKDMTADELRRFKRMTIFDNMTVQDYKNWLLLYQKDYYLLGDENLLNLRNLLRGETLFLRDIPAGPTGGLPLDNNNINNNINNSQKYYARMYDQLARTEQILAPIHSAAVGKEVGYNYNDYSEFAAPVAIPQLQVVNGQVMQQYRRPRRNQKGKKVISIPLEDVVAPYPTSPAM